MPTYSLPGRKLEPDGARAPPAPPRFSLAVQAYAMTPLAGRRILLIGMGFYDYEKVIADEFRRLGADVHVEDERAPQDRGWQALVRARLPGSAAARLSRHHAGLLERSRRSGRIDYVVVIKGALLDEAFLRSLRALHPAAVLISYQWDSMTRFPELIARQALFDRVLTFDHADAAAHPRFILRPTFFRPELLAARPGRQLDLCFVGWLHHDRLKQVEALREQAVDLGLSAFFYLFTGVRTGLELQLRGRGKDIHMRTLPFARYARKIAASRVIVDLPHPLQTGLTMRAAEAVGTGKKLLTTAVSVQAYDLYRPENVAVMDAVTMQLDTEFLAAPPTALPAEIVDRYRLRTWALDVVGLTKPAAFVAGDGVDRPSRG